jgi:formylglycine-generating enzyme required for sulfatase activity
VWLVVMATGVGGVFLEGWSEDSVTGGPRFSGKPTDVAIAVWPEQVYASARIRLRVLGLTGGSAISWKATEGTLLFDDLSEVAWRAPVAPGTATLHVTLSGPSSQAPGNTREATLEVHVEEPPTDDMVWIPPGTFVRGDVQGTQNTTEVKTIQNSSDEPFHDVYLDGYWMDRYPVTNAEYAKFLNTLLEDGSAEVTAIAVMGDLDGSRVPFYYFQSFEKLIQDYRTRRAARKPTFRHILTVEGGRVAVPAGEERRPIVDVSWFGAEAYARYHGKTLPSEAQWERAARGDDRRRYPWGDNLPTVYHVNLENYHSEGLTDVGTFSPLGDSPFGVADLISNCFEWTGDWFNPDYYDDYRGPVPLRNPSGPFWGRAHVIRGFPSGLNYRVASIERPEPVSSRYHWRFEFLMGDAFANGETTFRMVLAAPPGGAPLRGPSAAPSVGSAAQPETPIDSARRGTATAR